MADRTAIETKNRDIYGRAPLPWSRPRDSFHFAALIFLPTTFLGTTRPDGRPHAAGIGAVWLDGDIYFMSGPGTRKSRNLAANLACTISTRLATIDLVLEGAAVRVTDGPTVEQVAARCREGGGSVQVPGRRLHGPVQRPERRPAALDRYRYRFTFHTAIGNATAEPHGATRSRFGV